VLTICPRGACCSSLNYAYFRLESVGLAVPNCQVYLCRSGEARRRLAKPKILAVAVFAVNPLVGTTEGGNRRQKVFPYCPELLVLFDSL